MEPVIGNWYREQYPDRTVRRVNAICKSLKRPWAQASLDYEVKDGLVWGVLEIKTARTAADWQEGVPAYYLTQIMHYMQVTNRPFADVAVFFRDTCEFKCFRVDYDQEDGAAVQAAVDDGNWGEKTPFYVDGKSFNGDFNPNQYYAPSAESRTTVLTFSPEVYDILAQKGLIIHGEGITLTRAVLVNTTTGITETIVEQPNDAPVYDLSGRRVTHPQRGIYIRRGKKFVVSTTANSR